MYCWTSLKKFFEVLNKSTKYVVLRNYESFGDEELIQGHFDIDILCANKTEILHQMQGEPRYKCDDGIHYQINVNNRLVPIDIRTVGDGYYDSKWECEMLECSQMEEKGFYVLDQITYFYSLLYHALVQKEIMADDYENRLRNMAENLDVKYDYPLERVLDDYMKKHGYRYTYPKYLKATLNLNHVDRNLVEKNFYLKLRHKLYFFLKTLKRGYKNGRKST